MSDEEIKKGWIEQARAREFSCVVIIQRGGSIRPIYLEEEIVEIHDLK